MLASPLEAETAAYRAWRDALRDEGTPLHGALSGHTLDLGHGALLQVISAPQWASDPNEASVVIKLTMGRASFLLTGDVGARRETILRHAGADLRSTVLKVPHHGSATSSSPDFLAAVRPLVHVISVGRDNPYGHPSPAVLERLDSGALFRTDLHGDVTVSTDGRRLRIETSR